MFYGVSVWNWGVFFNFCVLNKEEEAAARFSLCSRAAARKQRWRGSCSINLLGDGGEDAELQEIRGDLQNTDHALDNLS